MPKELLIEAARMYSNTKPAAFMPSAAPVVHHTNGLQNYRAALLLIGLTGNFDVKGGNVVKEDSWVSSASGFRTRFLEYITPRPISEMKSRIGQEEFPVWMDLTYEAQAVHLPKQILSKTIPITHLLSFGLNYRMWPGSTNMLNALKELEFS